MSVLSKSTDPFVRLSNVLNNRVTSFPMVMRKGALIRVLRNIGEYEHAKEVPPGTPALFDYRTETVYVDMEQIFGEGRKAEEAAEKLADMVDRGRMPAPGRNSTRDVLWGMLNHEISHSIYSRWAAGKAMPRKLSHTTMIMEEIRVEGQAVNYGGATAIALLRKSFAWILDALGKQDDTPDSPRSIAALWALTVGRYYAGVAMWKEIESVDEIARSSLGDTIVDTMAEILVEAMGVSNFARRLELAQEWNDLFPPEPDEEALMAIPMGCSGEHEHDGDESEGPGQGNGEGEDGEDGQGNGQGKDKGDDENEGPTAMGELDSGDSDAVTMIKGALRETKEEVSTKEYIDTEGLKLADPNLEFAAASKRKTTARESWKEEPVTAADRHNARKLSNLLTLLAMPAITKTKRPGMLPPGRLRGRGAVQQAAERRLKLAHQATPWEEVKRQRTRIKPVIVGCMTDTSGSMSWAQEFIGHFTWIVSTAGRSIGARTAALTFGNKTYITVKPGDLPQVAKVRNAWDSWECFDSGCATMEAMLRFRDTPNASKVLFVVSDGHFVGPNEVEKACMWVEELTKAGTTIVWVSAEAEYSHYEKYVRKPGAMRAIDVPYRNPDLTKLFKDMQGVIQEIASQATW